MQLDAPLRARQQVKKVFYGGKSIDWRDKPQ
jgi:hypothetical protein